MALTPFWHNATTGTILRLGNCRLRQRDSHIERLREIPFSALWCLTLLPVVAGLPREVWCLPLAGVSGLRHPDEVNLFMHPWQGCCNFGL